MFEIIEWLATIAKAIATIPINIEGFEFDMWQFFIFGAICTILWNLVLGVFE